MSVPKYVVYKEESSNPMPFVVYKRLDGGLTEWGRFNTENHANRAVMSDRKKSPPPLKVLSYWDDIRGEFQSYQ